ncbi:sensor histidine kinase [Actinomadura rubteroloni]|uniref:sensor histidine kinase n=1 Tax=Actinomadura rubteroloni TaxID=1926885 RepID=UPI00196A4C9C|nr:HAMP domain-containing sensor histidine kinase [Actinomadura rubteroloni]
MTGRGARWRRSRLRTRLAVTTAGVMALIVAALTAGVYVAVLHEFDWQLNLTLRRQMEAWLASPEGSGRTADEPWTSSSSCALRGTTACIQMIPAGTPAGTVGGSGMPVSADAARVAAHRARDTYSDVVVYGAPGRALTVPIAGGAVQIAVQAQTYANSVVRLRVLLAGLGAAGIMMAAAGAWLVARGGLSRVGRLTETAELIAATGDPHRRAELPVAGEPGRDEVARLAGAFDTMLDVLERSLAARRQLVADASHELRTPLTALRTNIDILGYGDRLTPTQRDRAVAALDGQLRSITDLVNDLVELARGKEPPALLEDVRLDELARAAVETARDHWPDVVFTADTAPTVVSGVPARLARLVSTVLDNAAKFSPDGGTVEVRVVPGELTVRDHGPGIAAEDLPHIFDHFYRARSARALPGSGLGLAMARQIAVAHGASLDAANAPGGGTLIRLRIPG